MKDFTRWESTEIATGEREYEWEDGYEDQRDEREEEELVMNTIIDGDLMDIKEGIIIHQVNNKHVMGSGIAKAIRAAYPQHYTQYMNDKELKLGSVVATLVTKSPIFGVVGFVSQDGFGRDGKIYTKEDAFTRCLLTVKAMHDKNPKIEYYMPMGIGCGLGGGNWDSIYKIISTHCPFIIIVKKSDVVAPKIAAVVAPVVSASKEFRLIIAGGRDFDDYDLLRKNCDFLLSKRVEAGYTITVISGKARGADSMGERYARVKGYTIIEMPADWNTHGKSAGYKRNSAMADCAKLTEGACIAFHDGTSKGTQHMIDLCQTKGLSFRIVKY